MTRLLLLTDSYPPLIGGATRDTALLGEALTTRGHDITVGTLRSPGLFREEDMNDVHVIRISSATAALSGDPNRSHIAPLPDPVTSTLLRRMIKRGAFDLIHSYGWITYSVVAALHGSDIPLLLSIRDYANICANRAMMQQLGNHVQLPCSGPGPMKCLRCSHSYYGRPAKTIGAVGGLLLFRGQLRERLDGIHYCSTYMQSILGDSLVNRAGPAKNQAIERVIPSFRAASESGEPDKRILAQLPGAPFILFVGALRSVKGLDVLLAAYEQMAAAPPLVLIGASSDWHVSSLPKGVSHFENVSHPTVMAAWSRALFGVVPSLWPEPLGNVVHEAMSQGRPVVGTAPSGMTDMITNGVDGLLVPPGDVIRLREAMQLLTEDASLRLRLGTSAKTKSQLFTESIIMPRFEQLYAELIDRGHRA